MPINNPFGDLAEPLAEPQAAPPANPFEGLAEKQVQTQAPAAANPFGDLAEPQQPAAAMTPEDVQAAQDSALRATASGSTLRAAGTAFAVSAATLPQQFKNWYYGHRVAALDRQMQGLDQPTFEAEGMVYTNPMAPEERAQRRAALQAERQDWVQRYGKNVEALNVADQIQQETRPEDANVIQDAIISTAASAPTMLAALGVGMVSPPAGAAIGLGGGGLAQAGQTMQEAQQKTGSFTQADNPALINGILEGLGDAVGVHGLFNQAKSPLLRFAIALGYEGGQEGVTQFLEDIVSKTTYDPSLTWGEMGRNAAVAFLSGAMTAGALKPVEMAATKAREAQAEGAFQDEVNRNIERSLGRRPSAEDLLPATTRVEQGVPPEAITPGPLAPGRTEPYRLHGAEPYAEGTTTVRGEPETAVGVPVPGETPQDWTGRPEGYAPGTITSRQQLTFADTLGQLIRTSPEAAAQFVMGQQQVLQENNQLPLLLAGQLRTAGAIDGPQYEAFQQALGAAIDARVGPLRADNLALHREQTDISGRLRAFAEASPMPLLPYEERERAALASVLPQLQRLVESINAAPQQWTNGRVVEALGGLVERAHPNTISAAMMRQVRGKLLQANGTRGTMAARELQRWAASMRNLEADYQTRATTGEPFAAAPANAVFPLGIAPDERFTPDWSTAPEVKPGQPVSYGQLPQGHAYVEGGALQDRRTQEITIAAAKVARRWLDKLGFKNKLRVIVRDDSNMGALGQHRLLDDNTLLITMNTARLESRGKYWSTLAHEVGHGLSYVMLQRARNPAQVQAAIRRLWAEDTRKALGEASASRAAERITGPAHGGESTQGLSSMLANAYRGGDYAANYGGYGPIGYYFSYTEWLAHKFEQLLANNFQGMQAEIEAELGDAGLAQDVMRYLRQSWNMLKGLYAQLRATTKTPEAATFEEFVKAHVLQMHELANSAEIRATQALGATETLGPQTPLPAATVQLPVQPAVPGAGVVSAQGLPPAPPPAPPKTPSIARGTGRRSNASSINFNHDLDQFSLMRKWFGDLLALAKANPHIKELTDPQGVRDPATGQVRYGYLDYVLRWANERMTWVARADLRLREWRSLPQGQQQHITALLFDQTQSGKWVDWSDPAMQAKYPLTPEAKAFYDRVVADFADFNATVEQALVDETMRRLANNPFVSNQVAEIRRRFAEMRQRPYFPMTHFGPYYTLVRNSAGKVVAAPSYDTRAEQLLRKSKLAKSYPGHSLEVRKASAVAQAYAGIRPELLDAIKDRLQLGPQEREALDRYLLELAPAQSFTKHLMQRRYTPGFTRDAQRQYASYFQKGAGHIARVRYGQAMREALQRLENTAKQPGVPDTTTRQRIADYAKSHYEYVANPKSEWSAFRSAISVMVLGAMLPTALVNLTQVPVFTYPHLAAKYGDATALAHLVQAYKDLPKAFRVTKPLDAATQVAYAKWVAGQPLSAAEDVLVRRLTGLERGLRDALQQAQREGVIDQSFAMELAAMSEGSVLSRFGATNSLSYWGRSLARGVMVPFELAERMNRRVTFMAAYRLAVKAGLGQQQAYLQARDAVNQTQFEYGKWNRPELMRGKKGLMFMFMQYQLSALRFMLGGDKGWWRALALLFMLSGLQGMPFAEDLMNLATWMLSGKNERFDAKHWLQEHVKMLGGIFEDHPDLLLQGIARYSGPADLSGPMSLGRVMPGAEIAAQPGAWDQKLMAMERDVGGVFTGLALNTYRAMADESLPDWKRAELAMPIRALRNMMIAERWLDTGAEQLTSGANLVSVDPADVALKALGLQPRSVSQAYEDLRLRNDFATFYTLRREALSRDYDRAVQSKDPEDLQAAKDAIREYNQDVPIPALRINMEQVRNAAQQREKARRGVEQGQGSNKIQRGIQRGLDQGRF